uniref:Angiotensin-converting enzyme n=1 Tax=Timema genevievae TaxID=629358 RepID=A0A7R9PMA8_TIMGE|nr:unnamed protein product [Timema genevievae]
MMIKYQLGCNEDLSAWQQLLQKENALSVQYSANVTATDPELIRKLDLIVHVGEALLPENERIAAELKQHIKPSALATRPTVGTIYWSGIQICQNPLTGVEQRKQLGSSLFGPLSLKVVNFSSILEDTFKHAQVECSGNSSDNCTINFADLQTTLVNSQDPGEILELWTKWMDISSPFRDEFVSILESVNDVASVNNATDADSYWLMQTEFPGSYDDARKLWEGIKPLYLKLQSYVRSRLVSRYGEQAFDNSTDIPAHLLGSLLSYDWSNIADVVFTDKDVVYANIQKALKEKNLGGKNAYETAGKLLTKLGLNEGNQPSWLTNHHRSLGVTLPDSGLCGLGRLFISTYLEGCHSSPGYWGWEPCGDHLVIRQTMGNSLHDFVLPQASEYSLSVYEAAVGLSSLLASSRSYLSSLELLTEEDPSTPTLLLLQALRTLPRLPYYLAADLSRLDLLRFGNFTGQQVAQSWDRHREEFLGEEGGWDFMFDDQITSNKPYLGKFAGIIAQFQILEVFQNMTSNTTDILHAMEGNTLLRQLLQEGMSLKWPELLEKHLQIFGLDGEPLLRYFKPLEDFLDKQGSPEKLNPEGRSGDSLTPVIGGTGVNVNSTTNTTSPKTTSVGSAILIGCATVAAIGIVTTLFLIGRKRFKRGGHEYQIAKSEPI